jgi:hypothetical protein
MHYQIYYIDKVFLQIQKMANYFYWIICYIIASGTCVLKCMDIRDGIPIFPITNTQQAKITCNKMLLKRKLL